MLTDGSSVWREKSIAVGAMQWLVLTHEAEHVVGVKFKRSTCLVRRFEKHLRVMNANFLED